MSHDTVGETVTSKLWDILQRARYSGSTMIKMFTKIYEHSWDSDCAMGRKLKDWRSVPDRVLGAPAPSLVYTMGKSIGA